MGDSSKVLKEQWARAGIKTFISTVASEFLIRLPVTMEIVVLSFTFTKEVQLLCIQRFTSCYQIMTPNKLTLLNSKVQNFELTNVAPTYQLGMWIKE